MPHNLSFISMSLTTLGNQSIVWVFFLPPEEILQHQLGVLCIKSDTEIVSDPTGPTRLPPHLAPPSHNPRRRQWHPTPVLLPGKSCGWRSLVGCSPWGRKELDMTERIHFHFSLLCIGEGNGNPLQCSCLENPRDEVAQSRTWLKWLSCSSSSSHNPILLINRL